MERIVLNQIQCLKCRDIVTSFHRHDFRWCRCGRVAVDGGTAYLKRSFVDLGDFEDLSVVEREDGTGNLQLLPWTLARSQR